MRTHNVSVSFSLETIYWRCSGAVFSCKVGYCFMQYSYRSASFSTDELRDILSLCVICVFNLNQKWDELALVFSDVCLMWIPNANTAAKGRIKLHHPLPHCVSSVIHLKFICSFKIKWKMCSYLLQMVQSFPLCQWVPLRK